MAAEYLYQVRTATPLTPGATLHILDVRPPTGAQPYYQLTVQPQDQEEDAPAHPVRYSDELLG